MKKVPGYGIKGYGSIWTTHDEIRWLEGLGAGVYAELYAASRGYTTEDLLENYIRAAKLRSDWGVMNKEIVLARAEELLGRMRDVPTLGVSL